MLVEIQTTPFGRVRALFRVDRPRELLMELSINPVGGLEFPAERLSQILKTIGDARLGDRFEGSNRKSDHEWEEVMAFAKCCHDAARSVSSQVITTVRIQETSSPGDSTDEFDRAASSSRFDPGTAEAAPGPATR